MARGRQGRSGRNGRAAPPRHTNRGGTSRPRGAHGADPRPDALRPVLISLKGKGLVIPLTPEGRGHVVTHGLYSDRELEKQRAEVAAGKVLDGESPAGERNDRPSGEGRFDTGEIAAMREELAELRAELTAPPRRRGGAAGKPLVARLHSYGFFSCVISGQSSLRNGVAGSPSLLYRQASG